MWHAWFKRLGTDCTIVLSGHKVRDSPHALSYRKEQVIYYCSIQYNIVSVYVYVYIYVYFGSPHSDALLDLWIGIGPQRFSFLRAGSLIR